ncbi:MAG: FIST C-terminal domain-containing protein [Candidatus Omnitrophica bacterium]|nr:FIST C-terminal domain-containing protein [Candidatus Omnitrophota bacterium]MCB9720946.1 FIST C-terminal domain-containing protein [Candidatus Omnitrophota bacterium]
MKIEQSLWNQDSWKPRDPGELGVDADLVFVFGSTSLIKNKDVTDRIKAAYPQAVLMGCSTSGEIYRTEVYDDTVVSTAVAFDKARVKAHSLKISDMKDSYVIGQQLIEGLDKEELVHVFVLSDGINVNGSKLVAGISSQLPTGVALTGGLAGDGDRFRETVVFGEAGAVGDHQVTVIGLYGDGLKVGYGSLGGWDPFGIERTITKSRDNILYEMDGQPVLGLYKEYLGEHADKLPASGLLFPLTVKVPGSDEWVVRTILGVNEDNQSMVFAGDIPEGATARLMKANFERLIDGANEAAEKSYQAVGSASPELAILISCVGRKMILKQRIEEEVESVRDVLGEDSVLTGFYSYGEISPFTPNAKCELHNQTMTITTFSES